MYEIRLAEVQSKIKNACSRVNRLEKEIVLVAVTKNFSAEIIAQAYQAGVRDFGENRVQEWLSKRDQLPKDIRWHMIGHVQTNKIKFLTDRVHLLHSLDRLDLADALNEKLAKSNKSMDVLIQVNASQEATKQGFDEGEVSQAVKHIETQNKQLNIKGLMTIGPFTEDPNKIRACFQQMKALFERMKKEFINIDWRYLSMGMSSDFEIAIEEGANIIRVGSAIFGERLSE